MDRPEFNAYEINELSKRANSGGIRGDYYQKVKKFVLDTLGMPDDQLSPSQLKWLWGIKADLKEDN